MIYVIAIICICLLVVLVELLMVYQKKAHELREKQMPLQKRLRDHVQVVQESVERIYSAASLRVEELQGMVGPLKEGSEQQSRELIELRTEAFGAEEEAEGGEVAAGNGEEDELKGSLREATRKQEEVDSHIIQMQRDVVAVKRTLQRLENKLQRRGPGSISIPLPKLPEVLQAGETKK